MATLTACPPAGRLQEFALGLLDEPEIDSLGSHILECSRCTETLSQFSGTDKVVDVLPRVRQAAADLPRGAAIDQLIRQACRLNSSQLDASSQDTSGLSRDTGPSGTAASAVEPDMGQRIADMLSPPQAPDEIGRL